MIKGSLRYYILISPGGVAALFSAVISGLVYTVLSVAPSRVPTSALVFLAIAASVAFGVLCLYSILMEATQFPTLLGVLFVVASMSPWGIALLLMQSGLWMITSFVPWVLAAGCVIFLALTARLLRLRFRTPRFSGPDIGIAKPTVAFRLISIAIAASIALPLGIVNGVWR